jgi:hypothetical protein
MAHAAGLEEENENGERCAATEMAVAAVWLVD